MLGSEIVLEPMILDHLSHDADEKIKGDGEHDSLGNFIEILIKKRVFWPQGLPVSQHMTGVAEVCLSCFYSCLHLVHIWANIFIIQ